MLCFGAIMGGQGDVKVENLVDAVQVNGKRSKPAGGLLHTNTCWPIGKMLAWSGVCQRQPISASRSYVILIAKMSSIKEHTWRRRECCG